MGHPQSNCRPHRSPTALVGAPSHSYLRTGGKAGEEEDVGKDGGAIDGGEDGEDSEDREDSKDTG